MASADDPAATDGTRFAILGPGRLGSALGRALAQLGHRVSAVAGGQRGAAETLASAIPGADACEAGALADRADVVFVTVPDRQILRAAGPLCLRKGQALIHCSGALELSALANLGGGGAAVGCLHPLQSFPTRELGSERFGGITIGYEAPEPWDGLLETLVRRLGATPLPLQGVDRASYHAAAALASNAVVALHAAAAQAWQLAGLPVPVARDALAPLTLGAARAIESLPLEDALTGPLVRGDLSTVRAHLQALSPRPQLDSLYRALSAQLLGLGLPKDNALRGQLQTLLAAPTPATDSPPQGQDAGFMELALEQAELAGQQGDVPVGCVLVHEGRVIAKGHNGRERDGDPTAHAEMVALRQAAQALGQWRLAGVTAYVTLEPCPMCAGALVHGRVQRVVYGCEDPKTGALRSLYLLGQDRRLNHRFAVTPGILGERCSAQLSDFFARIRTGNEPKTQR